MQMSCSTSWGTSPNLLDQDPPFRSPSCPSSSLRFLMACRRPCCTQLLGEGLSPSSGAGVLSAPSSSVLPSRSVKSLQCTQLQEGSTTKPSCCPLHTTEGSLPGSVAGHIRWATSPSPSRSILAQHSSMWPVSTSSRTRKATGFLPQKHISTT